MHKVLLFSRRSLAKRPLQEWLGATAGDVVLVTPRSAVEGAEDVVEQHFLGHALVDSYDSWAADRAAETAARSFGVGLVASTSEDDVIRAARLRERLGLPGQHTASALAYRDKAVMKRLARDAGLTVPAFAPVDDAMDLLDFIDAHGYPLVVKPRFGAGAEGVAMLHAAEDLDAFLDSAGTAADSEEPFLPGRWMAEAFVRAPFFHVDGIMRDGAVVHCWPSRYSGGIAEHLKDATGFSSALLAPDDERTPLLTEFAAAVIAALPRTEQTTAFHLEAWIGDDGRPVLCEIACRAGGVLIADAYERAFGVHLAKEGLRAQCGLPLTLTEQPAAPAPAVAWAIFPPGKGVFAPPAGPCPVPGAELTLHLAAGTRSEGLQYAGEAAAAVMVTADTAQEAGERLNEATQWWTLNARWT
ncbi:ATP-grasp domain-containing protein [Streptomyces aureoversilis]|uniref:Acetyl-CoA carboxylase biotin carboxylase subunit family protein n=1 Tax=Streptomyces aureoversilis TaxID=67277 RepID=A0ABV9ZP07_9ACTN